MAAHDMVTVRFTEQELGDMLNAVRAETKRRKASHDAGETMGIMAARYNALTQKLFALTNEIAE